MQTIAQAVAVALGKLNKMEQADASAVLTVASPSRKGVVPQVIETILLVHVISLRGLRVHQSVVHLAPRARVLRLALLRVSCCQDSVVSCPSPPNPQTLFIIQEDQDMLLARALQEQEHGACVCCAWGGSVDFNFSWFVVFCTR